MEKFIELVKQFKVHKTKMIFTINIVKLIDKYPGVKKSSATLNFVKNYLKNIKQICSENLAEFKKVKIVGVKPIMHNFSKVQTYFKNFTANVA